jgi:hypothetical protein
MVFLPQGLMRAIAPVFCFTIDMDEYIDLDNGEQVFLRAEQVVQKAL